MALRSPLFTKPAVNLKLEACLVRDPDHVTRGSRGEHVKKLQIALQVARLQILRVGEAIQVDGAYGPLMAAAVQAYKNAPTRRILQPSQTTADDIVGKRTIKSLDDEMFALVNRSKLVSITELGDVHDHSTCPKSSFPGIVLRDGKVHHMGLPINPTRRGRMVNIGGEKETNYLGFEDFTTDDLGSEQQGRPLTSSIRDHTVSDICIRSSPITKNRSTEEGKRELIRLAQPGCRLTFASHHLEVQGKTQLLRSLGRELEHVTIKSTDPKSTDGIELEVMVIEMR